MSRIIREHRVFGEDVAIWAFSKEEAEALAVKGRQHDWAVWETEEIYPPKGDVPGMFAVYVAKHDSVFALND